jgi:hypothetical protein
MFGMDWRRLIAATLANTAELLDILAEEVNPLPPPKPRVRKPKTPKPSWYEGQEK